MLNYPEPKTIKVISRRTEELEWQEAVKYESVADDSVDATDVTGNIRVNVNIATKTVHALMHRIGSGDITLGWLDFLEAVAHPDDFEELYEANLTIGDFELLAVHVLGFLSSIGDDNIKKKEEKEKT